MEVHGLTKYLNLDLVKSTSCELEVDEFLSWFKRYKSPLLVTQSTKLDARILVSTICKLKINYHFITICTA